MPRPKKEADKIHVTLYLSKEVVAEVKKLAHRRVGEKLEKEKYSHPSNISTITEKALWKYLNSAEGKK